MKKVDVWWDEGSKRWQYGTARKEVRDRAVVSTETPRHWFYDRATKADEAILEYDAKVGLSETEVSAPLRRAFLAGEQWVLDRLFGVERPDSGVETDRVVIARETLRALAIQDLPEVGYRRCRVCSSAWPDDWRDERHEAGCPVAPREAK